MRKKFSTTTSGWRAFCERGGGGGAASGCSDLARALRGDAAARLRLLGVDRRRRSGDTAGMSGIARLPSPAGSDRYSSSAMPDPLAERKSRAYHRFRRNGEPRHTRRKTSAAFVPPKPNELESAMSICFALGLVRHQVDRRFNRRVVEVQRRRRDVVADREQTEDRLDRARRTEQVPDRGLGGRHRKLAAALPTTRSTARKLDRRRAMVEVPCALT